jgi:hypothetical protein
MKKTAIGIAALLVAASMAFAANVTQFKAGDISISVLDTDAATPMQTASIKALDASSGAVATEAVSDELGQAVLSLDAGRYVMNVNDINLAVFDVGAEEGISRCRIIMPDAALLVGGQEEAGAMSVSGSMVWPVIGGAAAIAILAGVGFAVDNNNDHHHGSRHDDDEIAPSTPVVYPSRSSDRDKKSSSDDSAPSSQSSVLPPSPTPSPSPTAI